MSDETMSSTRPTTISWSPASCTAWMRQSRYARWPASTGAPESCGCHSTPSNLFTPEVANDRHRWCCAALRMLTPKDSVARMRGHEVDVFCGQNNTSGGSRDTLVSDCTSMPCGPSVSAAGITARPGQKRPTPGRSRAESTRDCSATSHSLPGQRHSVGGRERGRGGEIGQLQTVRADQMAVDAEPAQPGRPHQVGDGLTDRRPRARGG